MLNLLSYCVTRSVFDGKAAVAVAAGRSLLTSAHLYLPSLKAGESKAGLLYFLERPMFAYAIFKLIQFLILLTAVKDAWSDRRWFQGGKVSSYAWHGAGWVSRWGITLLAWAGSVITLCVNDTSGYLIALDVLAGFALASFHDLVYRKAESKGHEVVGGDTLPVWYYFIKQVWSYLPWVRHKQKSSGLPE